MTSEAIGGTPNPGLNLVRRVQKGFVGGWPWAERLVTAFVPKHPTTEPPHGAGTLSAERGPMRRDAGRWSIQLGHIPDGDLAVLKCLNDRLHARGHTESMLRAFNVPMHGVFADAQDPADRPIAFSLGREFQALSLA